MKKDSIKELLLQVRETDKPVEVDAKSLTQILVQRRRKKQNAKRVSALAGAIACLLLLLMVIQFSAAHKNTRIVSSPPANVNSPNLLPQYHEPYDASADLARLRELETSIAALRSKYKSQQLSRTKELLSRDFFDNHSHYEF